MGHARRWSAWRVLGHVCRPLLNLWDLTGHLARGCGVRGQGPEDTPGQGWRWPLLPRGRPSEEEPSLGPRGRHHAVGSGLFLPPLAETKRTHPLWSKPQAKGQNSSLKWKAPTVGGWPTSQAKGGRGPSTVSPNTLPITDAQGVSWLWHIGGTVPQNCCGPLMPGPEWAPRRGVRSCHSSASCVSLFTERRQRLERVGHLPRFHS